jgi:hypothetical protein
MVLMKPSLRAQSKSPFSLRTQFVHPVWEVPVTVYLLWYSATNRTCHGSLSDGGLLTGLSPCCCLLNRIGHPTVLALSPTLDYQEFTVSARYDAEILCLIRTFHGPFSRQETRRGCLTRPLPTIKSPLTRDGLASTTEASEKHGRSHHP